MVRPREFDENDALEKAMHLFWRNGYDKTSVRDIVDYTGVAHAGIYAAFGDKHRLFEAALNKYATENVTQMFSRLEQQGAGKEQILELFEAVVDLVRQGRFSNGCFLATTAAVNCDISETVTKLVRKTLAYQTKAFTRALDTALARKEISESLDTASTAKSLITTFYGLSTLARAGVGTKCIEQAAKGALAVLD